MEKINILNQIFIKKYEKIRGEFYVILITVCTEQRLNILIL